MSLSPTTPYHLDINNLTSKFDPRDEKLLTALDPRFFDPNYDPLPEIIDSLAISIDFTLTASQRAHAQISQMDTLDITALSLPPPPDVLAQMDENRADMLMLTPIQGSLRSSGYEALEQTLAHYERSHTAVSRILDGEMHVNKHKFIEGLLNASELHHQISNAVETSKLSRAHIMGIFMTYIRTNFYITSKARAQQRLSIVYATLTRIQKQIEIRSLAHSQYQRRNLASYVEVLLLDQKQDNDVTTKLKCIQQWSPSALLDRCTFIIDGYFVDIIKTILASVDNSRVFSPDLMMIVSFLRAPILIASFGEVFNTQQQQLQQQQQNKKVTTTTTKGTTTKSQTASAVNTNKSTTTNMNKNIPQQQQLKENPFTSKFTSESMTQLITKQFFELEDQFLSQIRTLLSQCSQGRALQPSELLPSQVGAPTTAFLCKGIGSAHFLRLIKTISTSYMQLIWFLNSCLVSIQQTHDYCVDLILKLHFQLLGASEQYPQPSMEFVRNNNTNNTSKNAKNDNKNDSNNKDEIHKNNNTSFQSDYVDIDPTQEYLLDEVLTAISSQFTTNDIKGLLQSSSFYETLSQENKTILIQQVRDGCNYTTNPNSNQIHPVPKYQSNVYTNLLSNPGKEALNGIADLKAIIYNLAKNLTKQSTSVISDLYVSSINLSLADIRSITPIIFVLTTTITSLLNRMNNIIQLDHIDLTKPKVTNPQLTIKMDHTSSSSQSSSPSQISIHVLFQPLLHNFFLTTLTKFRLYQTRIFTNIREMLQGDVFDEHNVGNLVDKIPDLKTLLQLQFEYDHFQHNLTPSTSRESIDNNNNSKDTTNKDKDNNINNNKPIRPNKHPFAIDCDSAFTFLYSYFLSTVNLSSNKEFRLAVTMLYQNTSQTSTLASSSSIINPSTITSSTATTLQTPSIAKLKDSITIGHDQKKQLQHYIEYLDINLVHRDPEVLLYNHPEYITRITTPPTISNNNNNNNDSISTTTTTTSPNSTSSSSQTSIRSSTNQLPWDSLSQKAIAAFSAIPESHQMFRFLYDSTTYTPTIPPPNQNIPTIANITTLQQQGFPSLFQSPTIQNMIGRPKDTCSHQPSLTSSSITVFKTICSLLLSAVSFTPFQDFFFQVMADSIELYTYCITSSILASTSITYTVYPPNPTNSKNPPQPYSTTKSSLTYLLQGNNDNKTSNTTNNNNSPQQSQQSMNETDGYDGWESDDEYPTMSDHRVLETSFFASTTRILTNPRTSTTNLAATIHTQLPHDSTTSLDDFNTIHATPTKTTQHSKDRLIKATLPFQGLQSITSSGLNIAGVVTAEMYQGKHISFPPHPSSSYSLQPWLQFPRLHRLLRTFITHIDCNRFGNVFSDYSTSRRLALHQMTLANVSNVGFGLGNVTHHYDLNRNTTFINNNTMNNNTTNQNIGNNSNIITQPVAEAVKDEKSDGFSSKWGIWKKKWTSGGDEKEKDTKSTTNTSTTTVPTQNTSTTTSNTTSPNQQGNNSNNNNSINLRSATSVSQEYLSQLPPPEICQLSPMLDLSNSDDLYGIQIKITAATILMQLSLLVDALAHLSIFSSTNNNTASMLVLQAADLRTLHQIHEAEVLQHQNNSTSTTPTSGDDNDQDDINNVGTIEGNDDKGKKNVEASVESTTIAFATANDNNIDHFNDLQQSQSMVDIIQESNTSRKVILRHLFNSKQLLKKVSVELLVHALTTSCYDAVESINIPSLIKNTNYTLNQIAISTSAFVNTIKAKFTTWFSNFNNPNSRMCSCFQLPISAMLSYALSEQLILGITQVNKITDEGKMLLNQDISMLYDFLSKCIQIRPLPFNHNVTELITALYLDQNELITWINTNGQKLKLSKQSALSLLLVNALSKQDKALNTRIERIYDDNFDMKLESVKTTLAILRKQKMETLLQSASIPSNKSKSIQMNDPNQPGTLKTLLNSNIDKFTEYIFRIDQFQTLFYSNSTSSDSTSALLNHPLLSNTTAMNNNNNNTSTPIKKPQSTVIIDTTSPSSSTTTTLAPPPTTNNNNPNQPKEGKKDNKDEQKEDNTKSTITTPSEPKPTISNPTPSDSKPTTKTTTKTTTTNKKSEQQSVPTKSTTDSTPIAPPSTSQSKKSIPEPVHDDINNLNLDDFL